MAFSLSPLKADGISFTIGTEPSGGGSVSPGASVVVPVNLALPAGKSLGSLVLDISFNSSQLSISNVAAGNGLSGSFGINPYGVSSGVGWVDVAMGGGFQTTSGEILALTFQVSSSPSSFATQPFANIYFTTPYYPWPDPGWQQVVLSNGQDVTAQTTFNNGGINVVPEPSVLGLMALALPALLYYGRRVSAARKKTA
jgi:hypothetical protein